MNKNEETIYEREYFEGRAYCRYDLAETRAWFETIATCLTNTIKPSRVLDIGCAKGFLVLAFHNLAADACGIDVSSYAVSAAPPEIRNRLCAMNVEEEPLPFPRDDFDLVCMLATIEHLRNLDKVLEEIKRVLKPDGYLFTTVTTKKTRRDVDIGHITVYPIRTWVKLFKKHGFWVDHAAHRLLVNQFKKMKANFIRKRRGDLEISPPVGKIEGILRTGKIGKLIRRNLGAWLDYRRSVKCVEKYSFLLRRSP